MIYSVNPRGLHLKHGPLSWHEAMALIEEEEALGMLPLMRYVPDEPEPQSWKGIALDEPT
jgi:hypothetical protein